MCIKNKFCEKLENVRKIKGNANLTLMLKFGRIENVPQILGYKYNYEVRRIIVKSILKKLFLVSFLFVIGILAVML